MYNTMLTAQEQHECEVLNFSLHRKLGSLRGIIKNDEFRNDTSKWQEAIDSWKETFNKKTTKERTIWDQMDSVEAIIGPASALYLSMADFRPKENYLDSMEMIEDYVEGLEASVNNVMRLIAIRNGGKFQNPFLYGRYKYLMDKYGMQWFLYEPQDDDGDDD